MAQVDIPGDCVSPKKDPEMGESLTPWCAGLAFRTFLESLRISTWAIGAFGFFSYWLLPLVISASQGTLVSQHTLFKWRMSCAPGGILGQGLEWLATRQKISDGLGYLDDHTHLLFALIGVVGAMSSIAVLRDLHSSVQGFLEDGLPNEDENRVRRIYHSFSRVSNHPCFSLASIILAIIALYSFLGFSKDSTIVAWWGSSRFGYLGGFFSFVVSIMVFYGTQLMILSGFASAMLFWQFNTKLCLRPFHPDGANGLGKLGHIVMLFWFFAISLGAEVYLTFRFGYLGIEKQPLSFVLALLGLFVIPFIALAPLLSSTLALQEARRKSAGTFEPIMNILLRQAEDQIHHGEIDSAKDSVRNLRDIHSVQEKIATANVWPFSPRALTIMFIIYFLQLYLTLRKIFG